MKYSSVVDADSSLCVTHFFSTVRSAVGITKHLRKPKKAVVTVKNGHSDDVLRRTAALALQMCILNGLSLLATGIAAVLNAARAMLDSAGFYATARLAQNAGDMYFFIPEYAVVICSSNIGFLVHCFYSELYRKAVRETITAIKARFMKCPIQVRGTKVGVNKVCPDALFIDLESKL